MLDYFIVNDKLRDNIVNASILNGIYGLDHTLILLELEF